MAVEEAELCHPTGVGPRMGLAERLQAPARAADLHCARLPAARKAAPAGQKGIVRACRRTPTGAPSCRLGVCVCVSVCPASARSCVQGGGEPSP